MKVSCYVPVCCGTSRSCGCVWLLGTRVCSGTSSSRSCGCVWWSEQAGVCFGSECRRFDTAAGVERVLQCFSCRLEGGRQMLKCCCYG